MRRSLKKHGSSTTSWPIPKPTDVLAYDYLWADEAERGAEEGRKTRPVVVVLASYVHTDHVEVLVAPITTRPPLPGDKVVPVPQLVRDHLKLDAIRSWIVTSEVNRFRWPGPDLRMNEKSSELTPYLGKIPQQMLQAIRDQLASAIDSKRLRMTDRKP